MEVPRGASDGQFKQVGYHCVLWLKESAWGGNKHLERGLGRKVRGGAWGRKGGPPSFKKNEEEKDIAGKSRRLRALRTRLWRPGY